jgi:hypothetical protein
MAKEYEHVDAIGRSLKIGDPVAIPKGITSLMIGRITGMGEKQIRVVDLKEAAWVTDWKGNEVKNQGKLRYPGESVLLDGPNLTMYLLKYGHKND